MDSNLDILEAKVIEAVGLIKELKADNERLGGRCDELEASLQELETVNNRLTAELEEARTVAQNEAGAIEVYEEKRKEIEDKVGGLLLKLEGLG
jgi:chromosome segregation ATPase